MKFIFSSKKAVFSVSFVVIAILLSAGFYFLAKREIYDDRNDAVVKSSDISEFEIKDINGVKTVENKKEGFSANVPKNWTAKPFKYKNDENEVSLFSPESEFDSQGNFISQKSFFDKKACVIGMAIMKCEKRNPDIPTNAEMVWGYIEGIKDDAKSDNSDKDWNVISISGKDSLRRVTRNDGKITSVRAETPVGQTIYSFATGIIVNQDCIKAFDDFLKTVSINK